MSVLDTVPLVDVDSHIIEPRDLWSKRMTKKYAEVTPEVEWDEEGGVYRWRIGNAGLSTPEGFYVAAGWPEHFPSYPPTVAESERASWDPEARLKQLDATGLLAQVLYPNLIGFNSHSFLVGLGPEAATDAVRAYNDYLVEFASADRDRLIPIAMLPYWDLDAALVELRRVRELGFKGVLLASLFSRLGLKNLSDPYWDPLLAAIQDLDMSVNLHVGFNLAPAEEAEKRNVRITKNALGRRTNRISFVKNMARKDSLIEAATDLILKGTFERHPRLKVVSVESGWGYWPFVLDSMDWHWHTSAADWEFPSRQLPSEIWREHFYATFWFEWSSLPLLEGFQDNVMFETDYPHETGVYPGVWEHNITARELVQRHMGAVPDEVARKVLSGNAAKLYGIPVPAGL